MMMISSDLDKVDVSLAAGKHVLASVSRPGVVHIGQHLGPENFKLHIAQLPLD